MHLAIIIPFLQVDEALQKLCHQLQVLLSKQSDITAQVILVSGEQAPSVAQEALGQAGFQFIRAQQGRGHQFAAGIDYCAAKVDVFLLLHGDSQLASGFFLELHAKAKAQWGAARLQLDSRAWRFKILQQCIRWRFRMTKVITGDAGIFVDAALLKKAGGMPRVMLMEDVALSKKLRQLQSPVFLKSPIISSTRRWQTRGFIRTVMQMWWLRLCYFFGLSEDQLYQRYYGPRPQEHDAD